MKNNIKNSLIELLGNPYFIITVGVFLFYGRLLFGDMPYTGDFLTYQLPEKTLIRECFLQGIMPYMNPYILSGAPLLENIATGSLYPMNFLLLFGSPVFGLNLFLFIHVLLAGWSMCLFVNKGLRINKHIACLAGVSYSLGGCLWGMLDKGFLVSPWLILLFFLGVVYFFEEDNRNRYGWLLAVLALTFLFYSGNLLETYFSIVVAGVGIIWSAVFQQKDTKLEWGKALKNVGKYAFMVLTSIFLAAPQLIPTFKASLISYRSSGVGVAAAQHWSFPLMRTIEYFIPFAFGARADGGMCFGNLYATNSQGAGGSPWFDSVFPGFPILCAVIFFLILSLSSFFKQRKNEDCKICHSFLKNRDLVLFAGLAFFFMLALGKALPLYQLCYVTLPGFKVFRHPEKYIEWVNIFLIVIASYGLQTLFRLSKTETSATSKKDSEGSTVLQQEKAMRIFRVIVLTILSLLFCIFSIAIVLFLVTPEKYSLFFQEYGSKWNGERIFMWHASGLFLSMLCLILMFIALRIYRTEVQKIVIAFTWILLLNFVFWSYRVDWTVPVKTFNNASTWDKRLPEFDRGKWRIYATKQFRYIPSSPKLAVYTSLEDNAASLQGIRIPSGFSALLEQRYIEYFNFDRHPAKKVLDSLSVKYIAAPLLPEDKIPETCILIRKDIEAQFMILENRNALPRYSIYTKVKKVAAEDELEKVFESKLTRDYLILTELPVNFKPGIKLGQNPKIKIIKELPGKITLEVTDAPCWVMLRDWHSPGWTCVGDDNVNIPIVSVEGGLMGVFTDKKNAVLNFSYVPSSFFVGLLFCVLGILLVFCWFGMYCQSNPKIQIKKVF